MVSCPLYLFCSFLHRVTNHPTLKSDPIVREFLELENELPRCLSGQTLSGVTAMKILKNVGDVVGKLTFKMDEVDEVNLAYLCEYSDFKL